METLVCFAIMIVVSASALDSAVQSNSAENQSNERK